MITKKQSWKSLDLSDKNGKSKVLLNKKNLKTWPVNHFK